MSDSMDAFVRRFMGSLQSADTINRAARRDAQKTTRQLEINLGNHERDIATASAHLTTALARNNTRMARTLATRILHHQRAAQAIEAELRAVSTRCAAITLTTTSISTVNTSLQQAKTIKTLSSKIPSTSKIKSIAIDAQKQAMHRDMATDAIAQLNEATAPMDPDDDDDDDDPAINEIISRFTTTRLPSAPSHRPGAPIRETSAHHYTPTSG